MARSKKKASLSSGKTLGRTNRDKRRPTQATPHANQLDSSGLSFSLADEARNTNHRHDWTAPSSLRHVGISFISAGTIVGEFPPKRDTIPSGAHTPHCSPIPQQLLSREKDHLEIQKHYDAPTTKGSHIADNENTTYAQEFRSRSVSPSEEEVLLFTGRRGLNGNELGKGGSNNTSNGSKHAEHRDTTHGIRSPQGQDLHHDLARVVCAEQAPPNHETVIIESNIVPKEHNSPKSPHEEALRDYIINIQQHCSTEDESDENYVLDTGEDYQYHIDAEYVRTAEVSDDSLDTVNQAARDLQDALDEVARDDHFFQRHTASMTDEELARGLAKQEELGISADSLLILDGLESPGLEEEEDLDVLQREAMRLSAKTKQRGRKGREGSSYFQNMPFLKDLEEESYTGFDVLDRERLSIRSKKSKRHELYNSDSDLEESLQQAWHKDRQKKAEQKGHREELRSQGLLMRDGNIDMNAKYPEGMYFEQIKTEIRDFLSSSRASLSLPPMDKRGRKLVHELANALNLKSKSSGGGTKRYPCLYRTSRTLQYDEPTISRAEARISRRFVPRSGGPARRQTSHRSGGAASAAVYQDGDIVGATAPELGSENRGRAMLEKMGWSTGMALGASNNKGMLQPVVHVVKKTRTGLG